jgi:SAM-dependent methyltransferase
VHSQAQHLEGMSFSPVNSEFEFEALAFARNYRREIARRFSPYLRGRVLEIGCGVGQFTQELSRIPTVTKLTGLEPDPRFHGRFTARNPQVPVFQGLASEVTTQQDAIVSVNVLEHIEDDLQELAVYRKLLYPNGLLCLFVPARRELFSRIDGLMGHYRRYTKRELSRKIEQAGFHIQELRYFNPIGYLGWLVTFRLLQQTRFSARSVAFFDRYIFLSSIRLGRLTGNVIGQNIIAISRACNIG